MQVRRVMQFHSLTRLRDQHRDQETDWVTSWSHRPGPPPGTAHSRGCLLSRSQPHTGARAVSCALRVRAVCRVRDSAPGCSVSTVCSTPYPCCRQPPVTSQWGRDGQHCCPPSVRLPGASGCISVGSKLRSGTAGLQMGQEQSQRGGGFPR